MTGELPVVPLPASGEALGSWVWAITRTSGLMPGTDLRRLGVPHRWVTKAILRDLMIRPLPSVMKRLRADTGVAPEVLRRMTSSGLNRELEEACHHLFSDAIRNRHAGWRSRFSIDGPFQSGFVAANTKVASLIGQARRDSWRLSSQDERTGPGGFDETSATDPGEAP
ncbi:TniQ family protein [Azospirillum brasilense]|uniref:TniQ domain-containing protein n=1 Tax=Azospirillum brasilense TaxID=192 RepID=A0A6L3ASR5_AZOBR|nr:TniQ family protein [Azospirillum brasilense]KAA0677885.1 hypothetical protein DS837_28575 [Azospirillum brasilense]